MKSGYLDQLMSLTPAKISLHIVEDHKASTLLPIIEQVCIPGSIIHSDQWRAYRSINFMKKKDLKIQLGKEET